MSNAFIHPQTPDAVDEELKAFNESQREAIQSRGVNLLVSAGAGSGKTTVMIERIVRLLKNGEASLDRMAICTFTTASAADMRAKLSDKLLKAGDALAKQASLLATAQIGTIHSFCMKIVRRAFYLCDLDPAFTVLEEGETAALKAECAEAVIAEGRESGDEGFYRLYTAFASARSHDALKKMLLAAVDFAEAQPDPQAWLMRTPQKMDEEYRSILRAEPEREIEGLKVKLRELATELAAVGFAADYDAVEAMLAWANSYTYYAAGVPLLGKKEKEKHPEYEALHDRFKAYKKKYNELVDKRDAVGDLDSHEPANELCAALGASAVALLKKYAEAKKGRRKVDYADLEHFALQILSGPHGKEITDEYDFVFVDEYQDVNPLQEQILNCFHGGMFYVGDVKQSIYGFRMCTPDYFVQKRQAYKQSGDGSVQAVDLTENYRTGKTVLDFVNDVFSALMKQEFGGTDYAEERMIARSACESSVSAVLVQSAEKTETPPSGVYSVRRELGVKSEEEEAAQPQGGLRSALRTEVGEVVKEIERLVKLQVPDKNTKGQTVRQATYGDIAVLVRSRNLFVDLLQRALFERGIPAHFESSDTVADTYGAVSNLLALLRLLDNAEDDVSLAAALLSRPYGGFTEDELTTVRRSGGGAFCSRFYAYAKKGEDEALRQKAAAFTGALEGLRQKAAVQDIATLAGEITAKYDAFTVALGCGGEREAAALDAYIEYLSALNEHNTLHDYLVYLRKVGLPKLPSVSAGSAVRIMTVHSSKGLEFPFVILANLEKGFNRKDSFAKAILDKDEGIVLRNYDFTKRAVAVNPRYAVCAKKVIRQIATEELRVLYVAMTRAQYHLSLIAAEADDKERQEEKTKSFLDFLLPFMRPIARLVAPTDEEASGGETAQPAPPDQALAEGLARAFGAQTPGTHGIVKASVSSVVRQSGDDEDPPQPSLFEDDRSTTERGTAYHLFMEHARLEESGEWERLCARYPKEGALVDREEIEKAFAEISKLIAGKRHYREQPFVYRVPAKEIGQEGDFVLVQGVIDLLIEDGDGYIIVDYKTGSPKGAHIQTYEKQLKLYAAAVEQILQKKVHARYLYWFQTAELRKMGE